MLCYVMSTPNNLNCGLWWVFVLPTESTDLHVVGDLALCELVALQSKPQVNNIL